MLPFKSRRTSQPQDLAQIDTPVFDPDLLLLGSIGPVNLGKGPKTITGVPSAYKATRNGKSFYFNGASPGRLYTSVPAPVYVAPEFTFVVAYTPDAAPSGATYSAVIYSSYLLLSWDHVAAPAQGVVQWQDAGGNWRSISLLSKTGGKSTTVCVTMKNGTLSVYQDGTYCGSQAGVVINSAGDFWDFGERGNGKGLWWPGSIELAATSTKSVSTALARDLSANPWQLFKPQSPSLWIPGMVSGGGAVNYTLSAVAGGYSVSGKAATLSYVPGAAHYALTAAAGSYAISGKAATLTYAAGSASRAYSLTAASGAYALSGKPATLTYTSVGPVNYTLTAAKGAYSVIGSDVSFAFSGAKGGGFPRKKFQIETAQGVIAVDSLAEASRIIARAKKSASKPVVTLQGIKVAAPTKKTIDYKAIEARMRAEIQAEIDDEEDLLMML